VYGGSNGHQSCGLQNAMQAFWDLRMPLCGSAAYCTENDRSDHRFFLAADTCSDMSSSGGGSSSDIPLPGAVTASTPRALFVLTASKLLAFSELYTIGLQFPDSVNTRPRSSKERRVLSRYDPGAPPLQESFVEILRKTETNISSLSSEVAVLLLVG
jgi:hypothetical protein